jgi:carbonic anhydrase/acetyltransferase-like protein (isoleucine patch superfamily)
MLEPFDGFTPEIHPDAWVHDRATIIGRVKVGARSTVWPGVTLRGDDGPITIGADTSIQDNTVAHITGGRSETIIGNRVTVGHSVILHGCQVADDVLVGMGAILLDNCKVGPWTVIGAGALLPLGREYPGGVLLLGRPAKVVRELTGDDRYLITNGVEAYARLRARYRAR